MTLLLSKGDGSPTAAGANAADRPGADATAANARTRRTPSVRLVLALLVLLPVVATAVLIASSAASAWSYRQHAQTVARDAAELEMIAAARAQLNPLQVPVLAVSYASQIGINETTLDALLHPAVPFKVQLAHGTAQIAGFSTFTSTPVLRADTARLPGLIRRVQSNTVSFADARAFMKNMAADIDAVWYRNYQRLQSDVSAWQPPGSFEVRVGALRQAYQAFLTGGYEIEGALFVLQGVGPADAKQELIQASGEFQAVTSEFAGHLSPKAQAAFAHLRTDPADRRFGDTVQQGVGVALYGLPSPFAGNLAFAGSSMAAGLHYLADLNKLVTSASQDLHDTALVQASDATVRLVGQTSFLALLALVSLGGVMVAGRVLTRPLERLADSALQVHSGNFDVAPLSDRGPKEIVETNAAFNDMASTLKAVESKAVALAAEDLSEPDLLTPLPGRTGRALQASVDTLAQRIREREVQRQLLQEAATHDSLTGLLNRAAVLDHLTNDVSRRRDAGETVAVIFVDLDGLKSLNDNYGHEAGDTAILTTAQAIVSATSDCDVAGRLGGDEFLIVLCHDHSCDGKAAAGGIRESVAQRRVPVKDFVVPLEASVGVALAQCDTDTDPMRLVREADEAMYEAKKAARAVRDRMTAAT
jgi:diguanylate cyclase (GGDEF)-like protein